MGTSTPSPFAPQSNNRDQTSSSGALCVRGEGTVVGDHAGASPSAAGNAVLEPRPWRISQGREMSRAPSRVEVRFLWGGNPAVKRRERRLSRGREGGASFDAPHCPLQVSDRPFY